MMNEEKKKKVLKKLKAAFNGNNKSNFNASKIKEKVESSLKGETKKETEKN